MQITLTLCCCFHCFTYQPLMLSFKLKCSDIVLGTDKPHFLFDLPQRKQKPNDSYYDRDM